MGQATNGSPGTIVMNGDLHGSIDSYAPELTPTGVVPYVGVPVGDIAIDEKGRVISITPLVDITLYIQDATTLVKGIVQISGSPGLDIAAGVLSVNMTEVADNLRDATGTEKGLMQLGSPSTNGLTLTAGVLDISPAENTTLGTIKAPTANIDISGGSITLVTGTSLLDTTQTFTKSNTHEPKGTLNDVGPLTAVNLPVDTTMRDVIWNPDQSMFVAVGGYNLDPGPFVVMTSTNGKSWTARSAIDATFTAIAWSPTLGRYSAVGYNRVIYSGDGISWSQGTIGGFDWTDIVWSPELSIFCAVHREAVTVPTTSGIATSTDGINWTNRTVPAPTSLYNCITWSPKLGLFCAAGILSGSNNIITSPDGITWTTQAQSDTMYRIAWSEELEIFCAVAGNRSSISTDGINWTNYADGDVPATTTDIKWIKELGIFWAVGLSGGQHATSEDGIVWKPKSTGYSQKSIDWSPELGILAIVGYSSLITQKGYWGELAGPDLSQSTVMTKTLYGDVIIPTPQNAVAGGEYTYIITQDDIGGHNVTWDTEYKFVDGIPIVISQAAGDATIITVVCVDANTYLCSLYEQTVIPFTADAVTFAPHYIFAADAVTF